MSIRKKIITRHVLDGRRVPSGTPGAEKVRTKSRKWYGDVPGRPTPVPLSSNKAVALQMLGNLLNQAERERAGVAVPGERWAATPLREMLGEYGSHLRSRKSSGGRVPSAESVGLQLDRVRRVLAGCGATYPRDLTITPVQEFLSRLRAGRPVPIPDQAEFTLKAAAEALGISTASVRRRTRLEGYARTGRSVASRYPRETVLRLAADCARGPSERTLGGIARAIRRFGRWLQSSGRLPHDPLAGLSCSQPKRCHRHDRRPLKEEEVRRLLDTTGASRRVIFGLSGKDRAALYLAALATGFRAGELAELAPANFLLTDSPPVVVLPEEASKNRKGAVQPVPSSAAGPLRDYLRSRPSGLNVWRGRWAREASDMIRRDVRAAGIPYRIEGPDGPLYADFHSLRHTFVASLKRAGATLSQAMRLARHGDPRLTLAIYGREDLGELAQAVDLVAGLVAGEVAPTCSKPLPNAPSCSPSKPDAKPRKARGERS